MNALLKIMTLRSIIKGRLLFLAACLALVQADVLGQEGEGGLMLDQIIGKVDNYIILESDLEREYLGYLANGGSASDRAKCGMLAQLISSKLMVAKAEIDSVIVTEEEVDSNLNRRMQMILSQYGGSEEQ